MTELDQALSAAFTSQGKQEDVNKVYLTLLRTSLFVPIEKEKIMGDDEPFRPLFTKIDDKFFMLVFDTPERLKKWAGNQIDKMSYVELSGRDLVMGVNEQVYLCINYGTDFYKEFSPDEIKRLKMIVARIDQMARK